MKKFILLFLAIASIAIYSCNKFDDLEDLSLDNTDREFAVPVGQASFTLGELIESFGAGANFFIDPDNTIRLNYRAELPIESGADKIFEEIQKKLEEPVAGLEFLPVIDTSIVLPFGTGDPNVEIDFMDLKKGLLIYQIQNLELEAVSVDFSIPQAIKNGESLSEKFDLLPGGSRQDTVDLSDHRVLPAANDSISFEYNAVTASGESIKMPVFFIKIDSVEFSYAEGYFANQVHEGAPDSIVIDFFNEWTNGDVYFEDPKVSFYSKNSFGIPTQAKINAFEIETLKLGRKALESPVIDDPANAPKFGYPSLSQVGVTIIDTFSFDKNNSNIAELLGAGPKKIYFDVDAVTNPDSNSAVRGFIDESSKYVFEVEADLPLFGRTNGFAVSDTIGWDFSNNNTIQEAEFKIIADNELGVEIRLQGYFINSSGMIVDSLFSERTALIKAAPVDEYGYTTNVATTTNYSTFSAERFEGIRDADRLVLDSQFFSPEDGSKSIRIGADQKMNLRMGLKFGL